LGNGDLDSEYEGDGYGNVPHQNGNYSVRLTQDFYNASTWTPTGTRRGARARDRVAWTSRARDSNMRSRWLLAICGDPGVQYDTNVNDWNVTPNDGRINASNPCSEHMRLDDSACNLASLRAMMFVNKNGDSSTSRSGVHVTPLDD
jgi:ribonucleoside-diphosphate reductase alpha chain